LTRLAEGQMIGRRAHVAEATTTLDWVKTLLPVATFVAGFWLSAWQRGSERKTALLNMRSILRRELAANYRVLMQLSATAEAADGPAEHPLLVMRNMTRLSTRVYDQYLGRLDQLAPDEVSAVYDANVSVTRLAELGREVTELAADATSRDAATMKARTNLPVLDHAFEGAAAALRALGTDPAELQAAEAERGSVYLKLAAVQAQLPR
jgi:hypothetical protein